MRKTTGLSLTKGWKNMKIEETKTLLSNVEHELNKLKNEDDILSETYIDIDFKTLNETYERRKEEIIKWFVNEVSELIKRFVNEVSEFIADYGVVKETRTACTSMYLFEIDIDFNNLNEQDTFEVFYKRLNELDNNVLNRIENEIAPKYGLEIYNIHKKVNSPNLNIWFSDIIEKQKWLSRSPFFDEHETIPLVSKIEKPEDYENEDITDYENVPPLKTPEEIDEISDDEEGYFTTADVEPDVEPKEDVPKKKFSIYGLIRRLSYVKAKDLFILLLLCVIGFLAFFNYTDNKIIQNYRKNYIWNPDIMKPDYLISEDFSNEHYDLDFDYLELEKEDSISSETEELGE